MAPGSAHQAPNPSEVAEMVEHAVEVITILQEYKQAICPPEPSTHPPKWPWGDTTDDLATPRPTPSPPADRIPSPVPTPSSPTSCVPLPVPAPSSPTVVAPPTQEAQMTVFDGQPDRCSMDDKAKAIATPKYRKRSQATPPDRCQSCKTQDTPEWRRGPNGQRTLCNACGLHYAKLLQKYDRTVASLPQSAELPPTIDIAFLRKSAKIAAQNSVAARSYMARLSAPRSGTSHHDKGKSALTSRSQPSSLPKSSLKSSSKPASESSLKPTPQPPSKPPISDDRQAQDCCNRGAEPAPQYTHASSSSYSAPPAPSLIHQQALMPMTLPPPPQIHYQAPGPPPMNYFQPYVQPMPTSQPTYLMEHPSTYYSWGYNHAHAHYHSGAALLQWSGDCNTQASHQ
ncbi:hypothetical protein FRC11_009447 [Ceratobasidium sp. 423]|nr:hypothetical protein FRC11_009447 [Ceratobasidium sp. 423]